MEYRLELQRASSGKMGLTELTRLSEHVEGELVGERRSHLAALAEQLGPWVQGPFLLGGDLVIGAEWRSDLRWEELSKHLPEDLAGKRVLVVGSNAGYDAFMFQLLGSEFVLACEPSDFHRQAVFLESIYKAGIDFRQIGWQDLRREEHGSFDVIHCHGVVARELHPMLMLGRLRQMLAHGGTALIGGTLLTSSEHSEYARFIGEKHDGDPGWWWIPGREAMRVMLRVAGFAVQDEFDFNDEVPGNPEVASSYFQATRGTEPDGRFPVAAETAPVAGDAESVVLKSFFEPGHYYSPVPDVRKLASEPTRLRVWPPSPHSTPGIDWRDRAQLGLCTKVFGEQVPLRFPAEPTGDPHEYFGANRRLSPLDAWILQAMLRHLRPTRMIEVGSGYSSLLTAKVNRDFLDGQMQFTCIEPYPRDFLLEGVPGISDLRIEEVQDTPLQVFEELGDGDVLFVDTSHTVKTGGEVPWLFSQVMPRLNPGVVVHIHDIFLPGDYPKRWVLEEGRNWNEIYLVESFLAFNSGFEVLFGAQWMIQNHPEALLEVFPDLIDEKTLSEPLSISAYFFVLNRESGSSLWIQRRGRDHDERGAAS
jgi:SAM-dependent methyltransferase/predicted O-methyltransferase YrrM